MTLLANAGIYLVLDVNTPRPGEALNRYEPWSTYNSYYLEHVLRIVHQFAGYNNTLGFFAGNEVINDEVSARESPHYIKAIIRDMHEYMSLHSSRVVPVGYSAADDLRYRISLAKYLECGEEGIHVDFYGVNSYQWCGYQNFLSSGYDTLVADYSDYNLPIFLSEYGCNAIMPRVFQEVEPLYSLRMTSVFSGGLIYEFAQEANNYGLVDIDREGSAHALEDFDTLKKEYLRTEPYYDFSKEKEPNRPIKCKTSYAHLNSGKKLPDTPIAITIKQGLNIPAGKYVDLRLNSTLLKVYDSKNNEIKDRRITNVMNWKLPMDTPVKHFPNQELVNLPKAPELPERNRNSNKTPLNKETRDEIKNISTPSSAIKVNSSPSSVFDNYSLKLLFWSFLVGGPLAGVVWIGFM